MALQQWAYLAEIIASIAVVASLIYLGVQVRQSNVLSRAQARQSAAELGQDNLRLEIEHPDLIAALIKSSISLEERVKLNAYLTAFIRARESDWFAREEGTIAEQVFESRAQAIPIMLATERARGWWVARRREKEFDGRFSEYVDDLLRRTPPTDYWNSFEQW